MSNLSEIPNPYSLMLSGKSHSEVLAQLVCMSPVEQNLAAKTVTDDHVSLVATYIVTACQIVGTQHTLMTGALLNLFFLAVDQEGRRELFDNMLDDLGMSRTQAYRCLAVWNCFGAKLLAETTLHQQFSSESLKILSEERTTEAARTAAINLARKNERITIKQAKLLQKKYSSTSHSATSQLSVSRKSTPATRHWSFSGSVVEIQLTPVIPSDVPEISAVIEDLEAVLTKLKSHLASARIA